MSEVGLKELYIKIIPIDKYLHYTVCLDEITVPDFCIDYFHHSLSFYLKSSEDSKLLFRTDASSLQIRSSFHKDFDVSFTFIKNRLDNITTFEGLQVELPKLEKDYAENFPPPYNNYVCYPEQASTCGNDCITCPSNKCLETTCNNCYSRLKYINGTKCKREDYRLLNSA